MASDKVNFVSWISGRTGKGNPQRGASPMRESRSRQPSIKVSPLFTTLIGLPWRFIGLHFSLFSFWLVILGGGATILALADRQVGDISISDELTNLSSQRVQERLEPFRHKSFFGISLSELRDELVKEAWVADASLYRKWPNGIEIEVTEQKPVAYWSTDGLLNGDGELFKPEIEWRSDVALPQLSGPDGSFRRVFRQYRGWNEQLADIDLTVSALHLDDRGAWSIDTNDGWTLTLGKNDLEGRFDRFLANYPKIRAARKETIERIDMRYSSGMAVRWKPLEEADKPGSPASKAAG